jgi:hypothetical protein
MLTLYNSQSWLHKLALIIHLLIKQQIEREQNVTFLFFVTNFTDNTHVYEIYFEVLPKYVVVTAV